MGKLENNKVILIQGAMEVEVQYIKSLKMTSSAVCL